MKITILALGTRGDVQPYVALGMGLRKGGYEVSLASHTIFESFIRESGLGFFPVKSNPMEIRESRYAKAAFESGAVGLLSWLSYSRAVKPFMQQTASDLYVACKQAGAILYSIDGMFFAAHLAEKLNVPAIAVHCIPTQPTRVFPCPGILGDMNMGGIINQFTYFIVDTICWLTFRSLINKWRKELLNLAPIPLYVNYLWNEHKRGNPLIIGVSPSILPKPSDWGEHVNLTGYWFLNNSHNWIPPDDLVSFLTAGTQPVYIGFGSAMTGNSKKITDIILEALARTKQRGLLATGWGGLNQTDLPGNVFLLESAPHDWLFPKMSVVVHHGGAGTTAAGLRAGIPSIIVPFFFDQPFWGKRVAELGVGPNPIPINKLSVERIATAIERAISDNAMRRRAAELGERIRSEDGVAKAVELIDRYLSSLRRN